MRTLAARERTLRRADPAAETMTLWEFLERWLASKAGGWKPRTLREYRDVLTKVRDAIGDIPLTRVRPIHIQEVIDTEVRAERYGAAVNLRRYLRQAFRQAERWELLEVSPARNIGPVDRPPVKRGVFQPHEVRVFLEVAEHRFPGYYPLFYTAVFAGLRLGELLALPWGNVSEAEVRVDRAYDPDAGHGATKTPAGTRTVPITRAVYDVIASRHGKTLAFPSAAGTMRSPRNTSRAFARVIAITHERDDDGEYKMPTRLPRIRFHDLRRTAATLWAMQGATPKMIQKFLGHTTPHLALAIYTDVMDEQLAGAALDPARVLGGGKSGGNNVGQRRMKKE